MITKLTKDNLELFFAKKFVLVLFDADWNKHKELSLQYRKVADSKLNLSFWEADVNDQTMLEFFQQWSVANVPAIGYGNGKKIKTIHGFHNIEQEIVKTFTENQHEMACT